MNVQAQDNIFEFIRREGKSGADMTHGFKTFGMGNMEQGVRCVTNCCYEKGLLEGKAIGRNIGRSEGKTIGRDIGLLEGMVIGKKWGILVGVLGTVSVLGAMGIGFLSKHDVVVVSKSMKQEEEVRLDQEREEITDAFHSTTIEAENVSFE